MNRKLKIAVTIPVRILAAIFILLGELGEMMWEWNDEFMDTEK